ncbi:uncharacterized protein [Solanum lycopersicum]|uniref:Nucleolar 27S pre-rRNA processing Urb2/Npa2 C-terminal domain-containing protein n=1 Tax=Solanum lycopersicum TaxID=4081 RepID=A0A3Q7IIB7_SOLLC|nr:uncharacterized protein LOC101247970 isoform X1 [Solanum lycopersicum]
MKMKKRKQHSTDKEEGCSRPSKSHRTEQLAGEVEEPIAVPESEEAINIQDDSPWRNLQLILSLQNNSIPLQEKLELAYNYVKSRTEGAGECREDIQTVNFSRVVVFLNNWVQRILVSSEKKIRVEGDKHAMEIAGSYSDCRCWVIFRFCLEESKKMGVSLHFLRDLLRVIQYISRDALIRLGDQPMVSEDLELHNIVLDCISLVFSSHGGISNENLDLWISLISVVLEFLRKVLNDKLDGTKAGIFAKQLSCCLLEPFVKFLKVHPTRKNGFREFIDKLFEDLVIVWDVLDVHGCESNPEWKRNLLVLIEEVLSQALFHPTHIDGFLSLQSTSKYRHSDDKKSKEEKTFIKSYHRHLFDKLGKIITGKNESALSGAGELLRLFINCIYMKNGVVVGAEAFRHQEGNSTAFSRSSSNSSAISTSPPQYALPAEARKSVFDFFVEIMELFLSEIYTHSQAGVDAEPLYMGLSTLRSINKLLATCVQEKVYIRTEDTSEGACFNFLKLIYDAIMSLAVQMNRLLQSFDSPEERIPGQLLILAAKEIFLAIHYLVDIEYEVVGDDLEKLWGMILALTTSSHPLMKASDQHLLTSEVLKLGCRLVHLYSELRQVNIAIFTLSKAVRDVLSSFRSNKVIKSSMLCHSFANSMSMLLCSPEFRLSIRNAVKSIPEGQASGCIRQMIVDVAESLEWIKSEYQLPAESDFAEPCFSSCGTLCFDLKAEILGKSLTEMYTLILDSITITTGNSNLIALSVKDLMAVIRPGLSSLVSQGPDILSVFFTLVTGRGFSKAAALGNDILSACWIVVFFFRLYMSCRSLQRQAISLMPPDASRKMSRVLTDSFSAYSAKDWLESSGWEDESYFSWVVQPSAPLPAVLHIIAEFCDQHTVIVCYPLIYVLSGMALQRLVDLNRQMKSIDYLLQRNNNIVQTILDNDAGLSSYSKDTKKWNKHVSTLKKEAADLTEFMIRYLSLVTEDRIYKSTVDQVSSKNTYLNHLYETEVWDLGTGSIDEKLFPSALWWIICQNVDIWCPHASKKDMKKFLLALIQNSRPCLSTNMSDLRNYIEKSGHVTGVNRHLISVELLSNIILYEQRPICRHMASVFCQILKKSVSSIFSYVGEVDVNGAPDWENAILMLEKSSTIFFRSNHPQDNDSLLIEPVHHLLNDIPAELIEKEPSPLNAEITRCRAFLNLLSWIPKGHLSSKSFSRYATSILNIDRLVVGCLFDQHGSVALCSRYELLRLLLTCRRTFKNLLMASREGKKGHQSLLACFLSESSPVFWLLKSLSAVTGFLSVISQETSPQLKHMIFSLMDHTSFILLTLFKDQFEAIFADGQEETVLRENGPCSQFSDNNDAWRSVSSVAGTLTGHAQELLDSLNLAVVNRKVGDLAGLQEMDKISPVISCFQGFLCGLVSAMDSLDIKSSSTFIESTICNLKMKPCIETCANLLYSILHLLFLEGDQCPQGLSSTHTTIETECCNELLAAGTYQSRDSADEANNVNKEEHYSGSADSLQSNDSKNDLQKFGGIESLLANVDFEQQYLRKSLLQALSIGENLEAAFCLKHIFGASSAILKFSLHTKSTSLPKNLLPLLIRVSHVLLSDFANHSGSLEQFSFIWLDGVAKFIGELGKVFPLLNPLSSRDLFVKHIELHLRAMGKCISLQGKEATLASREIESSTKMLSGLPEHDLSNSHWLNHLDELKSRLRMSFANFVSRASELHLLSAIQAIERALVGVQEHCIINYEITTGSSHGAQVSAYVAAGIDCLDLILESVSGRKKVAVIKRHIQNLVSSLLNVILHLQGPKMFFRNHKFRKDFAEPDPGSVCLMCISVLTKISAKHAFFQLEACHIGQLLHLPATVFQCAFQLWTSKVLLCSNYTGGSTFEETEVPGSERSVVDREFCIKLYAACCRMLCTVLKHHRSETRRCIALLEDSVGRLLNCLEMVCTSPVGGDYFGWEVQVGVKCASFLRRVYEEIRQHKDVYGNNCFQFLSCYIWVYCGYGRLRNGIIREIDEALRPGVYALVDACSEDDLQRLHTVFGEGPCRNTLATLQHDYKIHFQYGGKV